MSALSLSTTPPRSRDLSTTLSQSLPVYRSSFNPIKILLNSSFIVRNCSSGSSPITSKHENRSHSGFEHDQKLTSLREIFRKPGVHIDAYIIPSQDAHQSEYIAECYMRRAYISGFTGSAGTAVVTSHKAALWTDGRYYLQAEKQLSSSWTLMRSGSSGVPSTAEWLNDVLADGSRIGIDPFLFSSDAVNELKESVAKSNHELVYLYGVNLVDEIWKEARPLPTSKPIRVHELKYAGVDASMKLANLRCDLINHGSSAIVISMLDEVAWLLNLRGNDVPHSPVMYAYLIVELDSAKLFVDSSKVTPEVMDHLKKAGVELRAYDSILSEIEKLAARGAHLWLDTSSINAAISSTYATACDKYTETNGSKRKGKNSSGAPTALCKSSPVSLAKAVKNHAELKGMRNSHLRDAAALTEFWSWLEEEMNKNVVLTEVEVADKLLEFRASQAGFVDTSFDTISGSGANGAIIHYRAEPDSCSIVDTQKLFLLDSGAQYLDGTTDITRTVHFGQPSERQKECFTRVLQGHIALDQAVFPENTPGFVLDAFARSSLWKVGLDYRHGTGHGVGAALNVHEGPQSISFRFGNMTPLLKGMIVSNEPGYYEDHAFGIRIENLLYVKEIDTPNRFGGIAYIGFEKLTFVPIQTKLIDLTLLSASEVNWLNDYHSQVWEKVSSLVDGSAREWLWKNTRAVAKP
ncbi:putative hydrolase [Helianthus annuus]|uniref:Hydrolase n=1 Tax=Helianthus annuus TaxID=4232 RepID=A0A251U7R7_HELAN|nr:aminopeptidase P2 [Helianthus annuus]KAF5782051.1 putative hydrolase [Helianthus annuus]KAJ0501588.1 putative hydrolase [Helianthus annuus]KAJ0517494.1 putative hydrolase [Helianthus annuus]KAJ0685504.1 putative hydrolase [Helianthus annuus]KAJ0689403.1 putative hydrolase [Helianthus annuus]